MTKWQGAALPLCPSVDYRLSPGLEQQRHQYAENHGRRDSAGSGGETAGKNAQPALFGNSLGNAFASA